MKTAVRLLNLGLVLGLVSCTGGGGGSSSGGSSYGALVNGRFIDAPVQGLQYYRSSETSDGLAADDVRTTGVNGEFICSTGETVTFSLNAINGVDLGRITCGAEEVFPSNLNTVNGDDRKAQMVALMLHHMSDDFDGTNLISANSTIIISSTAIAFMSSYDIDLGNEEDIIVAISDLRANRGLGALDRSNNDQQFENLLAAAQAHLDESVQIVEQTVIPVATVAQIRQNILTDASKVTDSALINDVLISAMNRDFYGLQQGDFSLNFKTCKTFAPAGIRTLIKDGVTYVSSDNDPTIDFCVSLISQALAEGYILSGSAFPSLNDVYSFDGNLNPVLSSGEVLNEGKFFVIDGEVEWFRSCDGASISVASQNSPCLTPENFNPIN